MLCMQFVTAVSPPFNQAIIQYSGWLVDKSRVAVLLLLTYHICHAMKRPPRGWRGKWYR